MPGNNFLSDNPKESVKRAGDDGVPAVKWTAPELRDNDHTAKSKDGFFDIFKDTGKNEAVNPAKDTTLGDFEKNKRILHEYDGALQEEKDKKKDLSKKVKEVERPWTLKTNLIKEEVTTFVNWQKNIAFSILGLVFVVLLIGGAYSYLVYKEYMAVKEEKALSAEIAGLEEQISQAKKQAVEADVFQKKLKLASELLGKHVYWSEFFKFMEKNTLADTFYTGAFSGNVKSEFSFSVTTNSYQSVDDQLRVFRNDKMVLSAKADSASFSDAKDNVGTSKISYDLELSLSPEVFKK
ncbi:MAG: hypothetical protein US83_C0009G0015 [Candidatus Falkowbacteria bacterium GW2011_GWC2_38_22]|uniref:Fimbrial assembly family protein n=1 Tax=Candidatus Falkowbacteria bacterium GW2011_GWE1_38_31 TaxID=1618638 RepID=A0A0G0MYG9_9BACT|nr:MAG: hypothetical protein US73_C0012G0015 [Candidatus Falkowbacteria bacterium GW2011_GWF2_38_1205]KKQ61109.1 MAG: hypothetical protein US83_C0009G0015 [Candidatus Falkowbacteria bacterium GW2011_GWC2_38_22]KKQ63179.1 MAG: hypothetical protein US84_C0008G0072 [Candidatus Falkowbacteria bacterium GW2011_GWF1_38_22]KKQ65374.1 MAG: hypothetical protein US87_C0008G0070 [Candidatus Falkowbacteria bacterium GW2011_GWE2_38_254]KKQ69951.1 MAG: hypothetical protein US91_C0008G0071 [Candidatus Falkowb